MKFSNAYEMNRNENNLSMFPKIRDFLGNEDDLINRVLCKLIFLQIASKIYL